jgi:hypothetical protein
MTTTKSPHIIRPIGSRTHKTRIFEIRVAFPEGSEVDQDMEHALDTLREHGAAVILREGVIDTLFDYCFQDLDKATWRG